MERSVSIQNLHSPVEVNRLIGYIKDLYRKTHLSVTGTAAPTTTPVTIGDEFYDTVAKKLYKAFGTSSSADWIKIN